MDFFPSLPRHASVTRTTLCGAAASSRRVDYPSHPLLVRAHRARDVSNESVGSRLVRHPHRTENASIARSHVEGRLERFHCFNGIHRRLVVLSSSRATRSHTSSRVRRRVDVDPENHWRESLARRSSSFSSSRVDARVVGGSETRRRDARDDDARAPRRARDDRDRDRASARVRRARVRVERVDRESVRGDRARGIDVSEGVRDGLAERMVALEDLESARRVNVDASFKDPEDEASTLAVFVTRDVREKSADARFGTLREDARRRRRARRDSGRWTRGSGRRSRRVGERWTRT